MERLTNKREADAQREEYERRLANGYPRNIPEERFLRLAAYEDTGLTPERCAEFARADAEGRYIVMRDAEQEGVARLRELAEADVAPVVRCKDCVHWDDDPDTYGADYGPKGKCMKSFETMCADDFCSYGERKDGES